MITHGRQVVISAPGPRSLCEEMGEWDKNEAGGKEESQSSPRSQSNLLPFRFIFNRLTSLIRIFQTQFSFQESSKVTRRNTVRAIVLKRERSTWTLFEPFRFNSDSFIIYFMLFG